MRKKKSFYRKNSFDSAKFNTVLVALLFEVISGRWGALCSIPQMSPALRISQTLKFVGKTLSLNSTAYAKVKDILGHLYF